MKFNPKSFICCRNLTRRWRWSELNQLWTCLLGVKSTWNPREAWAAWIWIQHCAPFSCSQTVWTLQPKSDTLNITLSSNIFCCFLWHPSFKRSETSVWLTACWRFHHVHLEVYRPWLSCFQRYTCPFWCFKKAFGVKPSQLLKIFSQCGNWLNQRPDEKNCCYSFAELFICRMNSSARGHRFVCVVQHFFLKYNLLNEAFKNLQEHWERNNSCDYYDSIPLSLTSQIETKRRHRKFDRFASCTCERCSGYTNILQAVHLRLTDRQICFLMVFHLKLHFILFLPQLQNKVQTSALMRCNKRL